MRAIRYGEYPDEPIDEINFVSQSAMRAIRYGERQTEKETARAESRNPLCVQLDME